MGYRFWVALLLAVLLSAPASAQCTGVFPANTLCGNLGASPATPKPFPASGTVVGPVVSVVGHFATWANTSGTLLADYDLLGGASTFSGNNIFTGSNNFSSGTQTFATVDINGGAIDGTAIGASSPSTAVVTSLTFSSASGPITAANLNSGTNAGATTYWRGDNTWVQPPGTRLDAIRVYTANDTWSKPAGLVSVLVYTTGGGGGGGGADSNGSGDNFCGSSGGGGGTAIELIAAASLGATETVTIGAAGTAGANTGTTGGNGGTSSFGAHNSATGGAGGQGGADIGVTILIGGVGGVGSGGTLNLSGVAGGMSVSVSTDRACNGPGGASFWGGGDDGVCKYSTGVEAGTTGTARGSGGTGGCDVNDTAGAAGGAGVAGQVVVYEFVQN